MNVLSATKKLRAITRLANEPSPLQRTTALTVVGTSMRSLRRSDLPPCCRQQQMNADAMSDDQ
jgi:hypothetical protein